MRNISREGSFAVMTTDEPVQEADVEQPLLPTPPVVTGAMSAAIASNKKDDQGQGIWSRTAGYFIMLLAAIFFSLGAFGIRVSQSVYGMSTDTVIFVVFSLNFIMMSLYIAFILGPSALFGMTRRQFTLVGTRGFFGILSTIAIYKAFGLGPFGDVTAAFNVCPVATIIIAAIVLKEPILRVHIVAVVMSLIGVFLITRQTPSEAAAAAAAATVSIASVRVIAVLMSVASGIFAAAAFTAVRCLGDSVHFIVPALSLFTFGTAYEVFLRGIPSPSQFLSYGNGSITAIITAICFSLAQILLNLGLRKCPAGPALLIRNIETPMAFLLGYVFLNEQPTPLRAFASSLIVLATVMIGVQAAKS